MPNKYVSKEQIINALVEKGQASKRYKLGQTWELNGEEIREAIADMTPADVVSRDCFNRILAENDKLREENKKLRVDLASAKAEFENYKSWERDYENGQVQGMW